MMRPSSPQRRTGSGSASPRSSSGRSAPQRRWSSSTACRPYARNHDRWGCVWRCRSTHKQSGKQRGPTGLLPSGACDRSSSMMIPVSLPACVAVSRSVLFLPSWPQSSTVAWLISLRQKARFFPVALDISFADRTARYRAVLGPLALQLAAEIPRWALKRDRRRGQQGESDPLFF
jgi:hypothetical protein